MGKREEKGGQEEGARGKGWGMVEKGWEGGEKRGKGEWKRDEKDFQKGAERENRSKKDGRTEHINLFLEGNSSRRAGPIKSDPPGKMPILQKTTADSAAAGAHTAGAAVTGAAGAAVARAAEVDQDQGNDDHPYDFVVKKVAKTVHFSSSFKENRGAGGFANDRAPECLPSAPLLYHCMQGRTN